LIRLRLDLAYDGTDFSGWAVQPQRRTVAGCLSDALAHLFADLAGLTVAGRTDAGVHATGQVCHVDVPRAAFEDLGAAHGKRPPIDPAASLLRRLAGLLPDDLRVHGVSVAPPGFDARFSALSRRYEYRVTDAPGGGNPLQRRYTLAWGRPLDVPSLAAAAAGMVGEHDFAAFCRHKDDATTIRAISRLVWRREADGVLVATVEADAFCWSMVRSLIGALLAVGDGRRPVGWPASLLSRSVRADDVMVAPAHGLTLVAVGYPADPLELGARAARTRNRRLRGGDG
jgi:tRNA pseudouridine38-40 synthase